MKKYRKLLFLVIGVVLPARAQNDSIHRLDKVVLNTEKSKVKTVGLKQVLLTQAQLHRNANTFTDVLRYNSPVVLRDYGNGGVSTVSFRGTSASNTQVLWNGIPINSVSNGQTDFNAIAVFSADEISLTSGGNSVEHGSGAIGGVIRLDNILDFKEKAEGAIFYNAGSFETFTNYIKYSKAKNNWTFNGTATSNISENDYPYIDTRFLDENGNTLKNLNGNYENYSLSLNAGYQFNPNNQLFLYSHFYKGERLFSAGLPNPKAGNEKYIDIHHRYLLKWLVNKRGYYHQFKFAYLDQEYRFFDNIFLSDFNFGKSKSGNAIYEVQKKYHRLLDVNFTMGGQWNTGNTEQQATEKLSSFYQTLFIKSRPIKHLRTSLSIRNEFHSFFNVPVTYALGLDYQFLPTLTFKANYSTNYRQPTFNELFWPVVGNPNLLPETTNQYDVNLVWKTKYFKLNASYFKIDLKNKILWLPTGSGNLWRPLNIKEVLNKGLEFNGNTNVRMGEFSLNGNVNYSNISSINQSTLRRIPFVAKNNWNYNVSVGYQKWSVYFQQLYQGKVFTNETELDFFSLDPFIVTNVGGKIKLLKRKQYQIQIGFGVNNLLNKVYYFTNLRPMPGRNYQFNINYKF